jgi:hypothetical protein
VGVLTLFLTLFLTLSLRCHPEPVRAVCGWCEGSAFAFAFAFAFASASASASAFAFAFAFVAVFVAPSLQGGILPLLLLFSDFAELQLRHNQT